VIAWTRVRLTQWGRHCRGGYKTGYPTQAAFVNALSGDRCKHEGEEMPADMQEVQRAVDMLPSDFRQPILKFYTKAGPLWLKAVQLEMSRETLKRRVGIAEVKIDQYLEDYANASV